MSLCFVFGASGSGKTEYILQYFLKQAPEDLRKKWFLIVPEQDTLAMQKKITGHILNKGNGILNIDVLSFNRLAYRVFEELGIKISDMSIIDDMGKVMILRAITEKIKDKLRLYQRELNKAGFLAELKSQISEFYQYRITPEMIDLAGEHAGSIYTQNKLHDLSLIYEEFQSYMTEHGYMTQEELLDKLYRSMPDSKLLQGAVVAFDGFTGFTPVQLNILEEILPSAAETLITCDVSIDARDSVYDERGPEDLFYLTRQTVKKLTVMAKRLDVEVVPEIDVNRYDARSGEKRKAERPAHRFDTPRGRALDVIERRIYRYANRSPEKLHAGDALTIWEASDLRQEVEAIAAEIEAMVRSGHMRYQDIGIIFTNPESYRDIVYKVFSEARIPYFFDDPGKLIDSPYAAILCAALDTIDQNFSFDSVIRYLRSVPKTDPVEEHEIDLMDNFLRKTGIRGITRYDNVWTEKDGTESAMESLRKKLFLPLLNLYGKIKTKSTNVSDKINAVKEFMTEILAEKYVVQLSERLRENGDQNRAESIMESIDAVVEVLDRMARLLGDTAINESDFQDILEAGLSEASVRVIPATIDQVVIGDLTRSRFSNPLAFFVAGLTSTEVPKAESDHKIITDRDRKLFEGLGVELAPDRTEEALIQRFYIYRALLNPSERLILSYPVKGRDGKGVKASSLIGDIKNMFTGLNVIKLRGKRLNIFTPKEAVRFVASALPETVCQPVTEGKEYEQILRYLSVLYKDETYKSDILDIISAAFTHYAEKDLDEELAKELYGDMITGSITRLEKYSQCAYAHFLQYGLLLKERDTFEVQMFDIGNLYHAAIERSFRETFRQNKKLEELSPEEISKLSEESVRESAEAYNHGMLFDTARNQYLIHKAGSITGLTLWALSEQLRRGEFFVDGMEKSFRYIRNGMMLKGRIDRVDIAQDEDHVYVKIIDYKSGRTVFDLAKVYNGLQLQLVTYMSYALKDYQNRYQKKQVIPAAMLYYRIKSPVLDYKKNRAPEEAEKEFLKELKVDGLVNTELDIVKKLDRDIVKESEVIPVSIKGGEVDASKKYVVNTRQFEALGDYVDSMMQKFGSEIKCGRISIAPMEFGKDDNACRFCPYHSVCKFDGRIDGYRYRKQIMMKPEEIWKKIIPEEPQDEVDG
ncbi:PD-(D/E)XK nuclease family protein [Oribacterium sp. WCC10]|uniref:PD-(D/E)XK nuclease family protein n=1 Tax=Oribacterium sp. WCC10 TaxID=1855343 RepID=UPI0008F2136D|nr:PD-(D/E)XK nuclease family protein [Oribacterium sp. WCC10]SFG81767.1 DNA helicase/exodeoxyribonuclease V, subunit B [Oribacterium sp. WCC10]